MMMIMTDGGGCDDDGDRWWWFPLYEKDLHRWLYRVILGIERSASPVINRRSCVC